MSALHVRVAVNRDALLARWQDSVRQAAVDLSRLADVQAGRRPAPGKWSIKEIIGHLIDSAANNHRRFVEAQFQDTLVFAGYAQDAWVRSQRYQDADWPSLVALWARYNDHLMHVVRNIPPALLAPLTVTETAAFTAALATL